MLIRKGGGLGSIFPISSKAKKQSGGGSGNRRQRGACGVGPPRSPLPPGEEAHLLPQARGAGGRSARKARNSSAAAAPGHAPPAVRSLLLPPLGTRVPPSARCCCRLAAKVRYCRPAFARRQGPSGAPSVGGACAIPGSSVAARRARVSAAAGERRDRGGHAVSAVVRSSPGMPLTAAASGSRGLSLPGLPLLAAREHRGTGGALAGCGRELLKLERPQKSKEEETEGRPAGSCLPLQELRGARVFRYVEDSQATGVTEEEGRRGGEGRF
ncbi:uncharacterized protein LOC142030497 [Buteo buteo]|uniref:uncharacterized protein LOC142030497 n=1 Tax=Buteo buteo TaxID=30397 RepID=UPI003EB9591A